MSSVSPAPSRPGSRAGGGSGSRARLAACASASRSSPDARPLALERRFDLRELGAELALDLLGAVELAAGAVNAAELGGEERELA